MLLFTIFLLVAPALATLVVHASYRRGVARGEALMPAACEDGVLLDPVTGLGNHRAFREGLHRDLARGLQLGEPIALALVDVDDFKVVNAHHGYRQGDLALAALAALLRQYVPLRYAYRLAEDRFALILPRGEAPNAPTAEHRLERLREAVGHGAPFGLTVSIGVAVLAADAGDVDMLHARAEAALREAKRRGRDTVVLFDDIEHSTPIASPTKGYAVRRLITERRVSVAFQPIWDLHDGGILAFEALTRPAPSYGLAGPLEAFDIAESIGRAHELDAVCRQAILDRARELPAGALLFLNLSPHTLGHGDFDAVALVEAVAAAGLTPARVVLEITEQLPVRPEIVIRAAKGLRALGFQLALDDVGAGNAGLEMLRQLPVDFVKIDRGVIDEAIDDIAARAVFMAIVAFAREARSQIIAEGIETSATFALAQQAGVRGAQGYLLGRPNAAIPTVLAVPRALTA